ncbi:transposase [Tateyamaria sp.]|uniref:transposase n=1 Tax=Tateyamaria sp. TaxID=1929288 RepID=UPI003B21906D
MFNQFAIWSAAPRKGNVSADAGKLSWLLIARHVEARYHAVLSRRCRLCTPGALQTLEAAGYYYAIRLRKNPLEEKISHRLTRPVGRPSKTRIKRFHEAFEYQAASWSKPRQVVPK